MNRALILELCHDKLDVMEADLARLFENDHEFLKSLNAKISASPGKRLRPTLLFLACKMCGYEGPLAEEYAAAFELIHTATLIHDDVIDEADSRRGEPSMHTQVGNTITVLFGDLLFTKAYSKAIAAGRLDVLEIISFITERMVEGELLQHRLRFRVDAQESDYFKLLCCKTAYLFAGTLKTAGLLAGFDAQTTQNLHDYGYHLGISFQLVDDILDYQGNAQEMGKPVLADLLDGKMTLPALHFKARDPVAAVALIEQLWGHPKGQVPDALVEEVRQRCSVDETLAMAREHALKAEAFLAGFEDNTYTSILRAMPQDMLNRTK